MKTKLLALLLACTGLELLAQTPTIVPTPPAKSATTGTGLGRGRSPIYTQPLPAPATAAGGASGQPEEMVPPNFIQWEGIDVSQALVIYSKMVNRTVLRAALPEAKIVLHTQNELTKSEVIQAIEAVFALNGISVIKIGDKFLKVLPSDQAPGAGAELDRTGTTNLPNLGTYVTHITQLKYVKPSVMIPLIQPFGKLPNSLQPIDDNGILVMRDYAENIKRMLEMIDAIDVSVPAEYISEVIPIRYAKVSEIASALQSLGGGGGSPVSIGQGASSSSISGVGNRGGGGLSGLGSSGGGGYGNQGGPGGGGQGGGFGARAPASPNGGANTTSFQDRLRNIVNKASGGGPGGGQQDQIQLFGQTKIIPNESSSTLLIYATRQDMAMIKEIIGKLDVPLAQVLVEALIMNVTIGNQFNLGVSAAQNPQSLGGNIIGGGGVNNGQPFANFMKSIASSNVASTISSSLGTNGGAFASSLPGGMSYFANLGPNYELAVKAAEADSHASIIQQPRLLASQSKPAQFFVGSSVPYRTSSYAYSGQSGDSYSQLSVGVELDVTPFINPDGEVTMEIQQQIDDIDNANYNNSGQPSTIKRTLNTTITVRDRDTVMLGGFIKSDKSTSKSGVPFLVDIPLLGNLFSSRNDQKDRAELVVLMRPTVMRTPKLVAEQTIRETQRLPGVSGAAAEDAAYEHKLVEAERLRELRAAKNGSNTNGFFNVLVPADLPSSGFPTNALETPVAPGAMIDPTPASSLLDPSGESLKQAEAVRQEVVATAKAAPTYTPAQKKKLDAALNNYMAGKTSAEEYKAAKEKILAAGK